MDDRKRLLAFKKARRLYKIAEKRMHKLAKVASAIVEKTKGNRLTPDDETLRARTGKAQLLVEMLIAEERFTREDWLLYRAEDGSRFADLISGERDLEDGCAKADVSDWVVDHVVNARMRTPAEEEVLSQAILARGYSDSQQALLSGDFAKSCITKLIKSFLAKGHNRDAALAEAQRLCDRAVGLTEETGGKGPTRVPVADRPVEQQAVQTSTLKEDAKFKEVLDRIDPSEPAVSRSSRERSSPTMIIRSADSCDSTASGFDHKGFHNRPRPDLFPGLVSVKWEKKLVESSLSVMKATVAGIRVKTTRIGDNEFIVRVKLAQPEMLKINSGQNWVLSYINGSVHRQRFWVGLQDEGGVEFDMTTSDGEEILTACAMIAMGATKGMLPSSLPSKGVPLFAEQVAARLAGSDVSSVAELAREVGRLLEASPKGRGEGVRRSLSTHRKSYGSHPRSRINQGSEARKEKGQTKQCFVCNSFSHEAARCPSRHMGSRK